MKIIKLFLLTFLFVSSIFCYTDKELAQAIFLAEGGDKAQHLYGIVSVEYKDKAEARQICLNTIRNQRKRHAKHDCGKDYLTCLRDRYCPLNAENDPNRGKAPESIFFRNRTRCPIFSIRIFVL